ncbi:MAG: hypothetical protein ACQEXB_05865 [Bacillota bacterium]
MEGLFNSEVVAYEGSQLTEVPPGFIGIYTAEDLNRIRENLSGNYLLMNDFDLTNETEEGGTYWNNGAGWIPIGDVVSPFTGTFNGNGYKNHWIKAVDEIGAFYLRWFIWNGH